LKTYDYVPITPESLDRTKELRKEEADMSQTEKKQLDPQWEDKVHDYITPGHFDMLNTIEDKIQSCNDVLEEAGIGGRNQLPPPKVRDRDVHGECGGTEPLHQWPTGGLG